MSDDDQVDPKLCRPNTVVGLATPRTGDWSYPSLRSLPNHRPAEQAVRGTARTSPRHANQRQRRHEERTGRSPRTQPGGRPTHAHLTDHAYISASAVVISASLAESRLVRSAGTPTAHIFAFRRSHRSGRCGRRYLHRGRCAIRRFRSINDLARARRGCAEAAPGSDRDP